MILTRWHAVVLVLILGSPATHGDEQRGKAPDPPAAPGPPMVKIEVVPDGDDGLSEIRAAPGYKAAYRKARDEADASLKDGRARLLSYGMLGMSDLDPETGLAVVPIAGCVVGEDVLGRTEGNNDRVRTWVKEHGPPANSLVRWKDELSDLPAFFAAKTKVGATVPLRIGGPNLTSPDGRFTLRQVAVRVNKAPTPFDRTVTTIGLEVSERGTIREVMTDDWGDGLTDLVWGPPGAPFAVVKSRGHDGPDYQLLHLRPVDWVMPRVLSWQRYLKEHPESPFNKRDPA
jgi:hypothetical protein